MVKSYIICTKLNWMYFLEVVLPDIISERIKTYELDELKKFLRQNFRKISQEEVIELKLKYTYDLRLDNREYYEKELEELGQGVSYYSVDNLSDNNSLIEKALYQGEVFLEDKVDNIDKGIVLFELD